MNKFAIFICLAAILLGSVLHGAQTEVTGREKRDLKKFFGKLKEAAHNFTEGKPVHLARQCNWSWKFGSGWSKNCTSEVAPVDFFNSTDFN